MKTFLTQTQDETTDLGRSFSSQLKPGDVVACFGNLGSGKTRFIMGVCEGLQVQSRVGSPTFTLINEYEAPTCTVAHIDLYRINSPTELLELGIEEYFNDRCICLIEWAEAVLGILPRNHYRVTMRYGARDQEREIMIEEVEGIAV